MNFGVASMTAPLRRVALRKPGVAMQQAEVATWHYGPSFDKDRVEAEQFIETSVLRTRHGAKATRIEISRKGNVEGPLIGEIIILKDKVEAQSSQE